MNEKFENEYEDKEYVKYFEDTTKSKVNEKDKPILNEVMKANKKESVSQKGFDKFRNIKTLFVDTIDYLYNICASEVDPLEKLEKVYRFYLVNMKMYQKKILFIIQLKIL